MTATGMRTCLRRKEPFSETVLDSQRENLDGLPVIFLARVRRRTSAVPTRATTKSFSDVVVKEEQPMNIRIMEEHGK
jgi:hypothetical protein